MAIQEEGDKLLDAKKICGMRATVKGLSWKEEAELVAGG